MNPTTIAKRIFLLAALLGLPLWVTSSAAAAPPTTLPVISISDVTKLEGNSGKTAFDFAVTISEPSKTKVTVSYSTADRTATADSGDYSRTSGSLTFSKGETTQKITVNVNGDTAEL